MVSASSSRFFRKALALLVWSASAQSEDMNDGKSWITVSCAGLWSSDLGYWLEFAMCPLADIEFRKNYDANIRAKYGPPIIQIPNLNPDLRMNLNVGHTDGSVKRGMDYALKVFQGLTKDGFTYDVVNAILAASSSSVSAPMAALADQFDIPMISAMATSPVLSNKDKYPTFFRACPPDTIQGVALFALILDLQIPSVVVPYTMEPYGQGLFEVIRSSADGNKQGQRVKGLGVIRHENGEATPAYIKEQVDHILSLESRVVIFVMLWAEVKAYLAYMMTNNLLGTADSPGIQLLGADAFASPMPDFWLDVGVLFTFPQNRGPLWDSFMTDLWTKLTVEDMTGTQAAQRYELDRIPADIPIYGDADVPPPTDALFKVPNPSSYAPYIIDCIFSIIIAANNALNEGVAINDIRGQTLIEYMQKVSFEGASGQVSFDAQQDRSANIELLNLQLNDQGERFWESVMVYSAADGTVTRYEGKDIIWMTQERGRGFPPSLGNCAEGSYQDAAGDQPTLMCLKCPAGKVSSGGSVTACTDCSAGRAANAEDGATQCDVCPAGTYSAESKSTHCTSCPAGSFGASVGTTACTACPVGTYNEDIGQIGCVSCGTGKKNQELWTTMKKVTQSNGKQEWSLLEGAAAPNTCGCTRGAFAENGDCHACGEGIDCLGMGDILVEEGYFMRSDRPGFVWQCYGSIRPRCTGGLPGVCAAGRDNTSLACTACEDGKKTQENGTCVDCKGGDLMPLFVVLLCMFVVLFLGYRMIDRNGHGNKNKSILLVAITASQIFTLLQQLAAFSTIQLDWPPPFSGLLEFASIFTFQLDYISLGCVAPMSALGKMALRVFMVLLLFLTMLAIHSVSVVVRHKGDWNGQWPVFVGSVGTIFSAFFISIVASMLSPFQCVESPNGLRTVKDYPDVVCWDSDYGSDHGAMVAIGLIAALIPLSFLSLTIWVLRQLPARLAESDTNFLKAFSFLFFRFRPGRQWYMLIFLLRNTAIAIVPVLGSEIVQIMFLQLVILPVYTVTVYFTPWVVPIANWVDMGISCLLSMLLIAFALFASGAEPVLLAEICCVIVTLAFAVLLAAIGYGIYERFARKSKPYAYFICHHKAGAGNMSRLLKMSLQASPHVTKKVFVDSDDLTDLNTLFGYVGSDVDTLVVVCSRDILSRPWCMGEVTTSKAMDVPVIKIIMPDFSWPEDAFFDDYAKLVPGVETLIEHGMSVTKVIDAIHWLKDQTTIEHPERLDGSTMKALAGALVNAAANKPFSMGELRTTTTVTDRATTGENVIVADTVNMESAAATWVVQKLLASIMSNDIAKIPKVVEDPEADITKKTKQVILVCCQGTLRSEWVQCALLRATELNCCILPVVSEPAFRFPTKDFLSELAHDRPILKTPSGNYRGEVLGVVLTRVFTEIAVEVDPQDSDKIIEVRARTVALRLGGGLRPMGLAGDLGAYLAGGIDQSDVKLNEVVSHETTTPDEDFLSEYSL